MQVDVVRATADQEPVIANLLELYAHDFSEFFDLKIGVDGRFGYKPLPLYWRDSNRFPFLVRANGDLAGFVLVQKGSAVSGAADIWDMAEFFVLRRYRKQRVGLRVAHSIWQMFPGRWEVRVSEHNSVALSFWNRAVSEFTGDKTESAFTEVAGKRCHLFSFVSGEQNNNSSDGAGIRDLLIPDA
jgi:predicted acetyltransferase